MGNLLGRVSSVGATRVADELSDTQREVNMLQRRVTASEQAVAAATLLVENTSQSNAMVYSDAIYNDAVRKLQIARADLANNVSMLQSARAVASAISGTTNKPTGCRTAFKGCTDSNASAISRDYNLKYARQNNQILRDTTSIRAGPVANSCVLKGNYLDRDVEDGLVQATRTRQFDYQCTGGEWRLEDIHDVEGMAPGNFAY